MNLLNLWAVAVCEIRSCSRLARTWVFIGLAFLFSAGAYVWFCLQHMWMSTIGPSPNIQIPRFIAGESASVFILLFSLGIIFLAFDIRARDIRDRISGIIDAKPVSNLELVIGRLAGMLTLLCIPIVVFMVLVMLLGQVAGMADWGFGAPVEPWSVLSFLVWDVIPNLAWIGGLVMLLAVILRFRLLVALVTLGLFALQTWITLQLSWGQQEVIGAVTSQVVHPSDIAPIFATTSILIQRFGWILLSIGLLVTAAAFLPRQLPKRPLWASAGFGSFVIGFLVLFGLFQSQANEVEIRNSWKLAHQAQDVSSFPNVKHLEGNIQIRPRKRVELDLVLTLVPPAQNATDQVTFTLNPGYHITSLVIDSVEINDHTFESGLLKIPVRYFGSDAVRIEIKADGKPDPRFAYLDARIDLKNAGVTDFSVAMARFLGNQSYLFQSDYVALLAGVSWYPTAGVAVGRDDLRNFPRDHFTVDITVSVPNNWYVAGPGTSELQLAEGKHTSYRFRPANPVIDVALIGAKFERVSLSVRDIEFELLYSAKHHRTFAAMEPLVPALQEWIEDRLATVNDRYGLSYPYDTLTLVEVPAHLRVLGGGWRMDSNLYAPGIVMIRETGLPTARFDVRFKDQEGEQIFQQLLDYLDNDLQGGNPFNGIARDFLNHQMSPSGLGAVALGLFLEDLVGSLIVDRLPYYTTDTALSVFGVQQVALANQLEAQQGQSDVSISVNIGNGQQGLRLTDRSGAEIVRSQNINSTRNWTEIEQAPLVDFNFQEQPILSYNAALLKNSFVLSNLIGWIGEEKLGQMLTTFLQRYRGMSFSYEDFRNFASTYEPKFSDLTHDWIVETQLPGYVVTAPTVVQAETDDPNDKLIQTVFKLRNSEPIPGLIQVHWSEEEEYGTNSGEVISESLPPALIEGHSSYQFTIETSLVPLSITIDVPLSFNRRPIQLALPAFDSLEEVPMGRTEKQPTIQQVEWNPQRENYLIIDDLDAGFFYSGTPRELELPWFVSTFMGAGLEALGITDNSDYGLPVQSPGFDPRQWVRVQNSGYGRYRETFAQSRHIEELIDDEEDFSAGFSATLPNSGAWTLEYSVPLQVLVDHYFSIRNQSDIDTSAPTSLTLNVRINGDTRSLEIDVVKLADELDVASWSSIIEGWQWDRQVATRKVKDSKNGYSDFYWVNLGTFNISDPEVVVEISNENTYPTVFADAVRWTKLDTKTSD